MEKKIYWVTGARDLKAAKLLRDAICLETALRYRQPVECAIAIQDDGIYAVGIDDYTRSQDAELWNDAMDLVAKWGYWGVKWLYVKIRLWTICHRIHRFLMGM